jgi:Antibiotic biosynthesis monooxygenase
MISSKCSMANFIEMDDHVKFLSQLEENVGPIIFINKFTVNHKDVNEFFEGLESRCHILQEPTWVISAQLHKGIGGSGTFINYAVWESTAQLKKAVNNTDFQTMLSKYPASTIISPYIFKKVAVRGICVE